MSLLTLTDTVKRYIQAGRLNSPRGLKGEIRFSCYCDSPEFLSGVERLYLDEEGKTPLEVALYRPTIPSIVFKGYEDRDLAATLNGRTVWFDRNDITLPEGVFYLDDLVGETATDAKTGESIGIVADVEEIAGKIYYVIKGGTTFRIPAVEEHVIKAAPGEGIVVNIPEGLV